MKRKRSGSDDAKTSKTRSKEPDYHLTPSVHAEDGEIVWPAPKEQMARAREVILECARSNAKTIIIPDKDVDGLTSGVILHRTLTALGADPNNLSFHLPQKGENVHSPSESIRMAAVAPTYIFVLDQGSRHSPPLIPSPHTCLVIDHHFASLDDKPEGAIFVNACHSPPVATSSLLTYELCAPLHTSIPASCGYLCALGTYADLGNSIKWEPPFPDLNATVKANTKKAMTDAVALLNAPRRTPRYDVGSALEALVKSSTAKDVLGDRRLLEARDEIRQEVERCTHTAPKFSRDGRLAVFRIKSEAQVHPLIATRWANHLTSKTLEIVMVANSGHLPDKVNFSCRIARVARTRPAASDQAPVDIITFLKAAADAHPSGTLRQRMGEDFARGHVQASGGIVGEREFEDLMEGLGVGEKAEKKEGEVKKSPVKSRDMPKQNNTLANYFAKK